MITTELDRYELTLTNTDPVVFRSGGTTVPIQDTTHVKVHVTTTGAFTAAYLTSTINLTDTSHGHINGETITLSSTTTLPTGLLANTVYYVVGSTANTFQVSLTSGGSAVAFTNNGTGTLTWTKTLLKTISTDYTVQLGGTGGVEATITWVIAPAVGDKVLFLRDVPFEQNTDLQNNSQFEAESVESQLDLMVNMSQQLKNNSDRQLKFSSVLVASDATEASATLTATSDGRKNKSLKFDSSGNLGVTTIDIDKAEDYVLEAKSYATESPAVVNHYTGTVATAQTGVYSAKEHASGSAVTTGSAKDFAIKDDGAIGTTGEFSAKAYAQGGTGVTGATGSSKDWATLATTPSSTAQDASAKEWAIGTSTHKSDGSAKDWASQVGADVRAGASGDKSAKSWAQETGGTAPADGSAKEWATNAGSAEVATGAGYSSKAYAQDTGNDIGSSKDWAVLATQVSSTDYSSKQYAVGTPPDGSAKEWAKDTGGEVADSEFSAKAYASEVGTNAPTVGSAKEWATTTGSAIASSEFSAKEYSQGETATGGTSKQWSLGGGSHVVGTAVTGTSYASKAYAQSTTAGTSTYGGSAKGWASTAYDAAVPGAGASDRSALHYSTDASNSAIAAKNSAAAVANSFDSFDDTYLGAMKDPFVFTASSDSGLLISDAAHGLLDGNIVQVASAGTLPTGLSASTNYYVVSKTTNNFKLATSSGGSAIAYTNAGSGSHTWVYGSPTTNGTWPKNSSTITVVSNVGIRVGQKVSGSGIPASPIPNVLSIDGTAVVISENMAAANVGTVAVTFSSLGINGPYNTSTDGPSADNDGEALVSGNLFFNSTDNEMRIFDGANWIAATSAGSTSLLIYKYVATASQTTFTGADANGATLSYTAENINVFLNGVRLDASDYTASSGTSIVLGVGAAVSDELVVTAYKSFTTADMVSSSAGGTFNNNVSFGDNNITNVGSIALDSIVADGTSIVISSDMETATNKKIKQKGAFMQSSTHQALTLGA